MPRPNTEAPLVGTDWLAVSAVDIDLAKFFDTVNHDVLMNLLGRTIADKPLLRLIGRYLRAGVPVGEHIQPSEVGTPQGGPLSPLLANILLDQLDRELQRRGHRFVRYAEPGHKASSGWLVPGEGTGHWTVAPCKGMT